MKLRFSLRSLLMLPVMFAVLWMWTTWPHRTFKEFTNAVRSDRFELAKSMVDSKECSFEFGPTELRMESDGMFLRVYRPSHFIDEITREDRSFRDMLCARSVYRVPASVRSPRTPQFEFLVERGQIVMHCR